MRCSLAILISLVSLAPVAGAQEKQAPTKTATLEPLPGLRFMFVLSK